MSASSGAGSSRKSGSTSTAPTTTSAPPNGQQQQVGGAVAPTKLPKEWAVADLLRTQTSLLKRLKNVATAGGSHIEKQLESKIQTALIDAGVPTTLLDGRQVAAPSNDPLPPSIFPTVITHWTTWCHKKGLFTLPVMGAVVCIFLAADVPKADRKKTVFVLETVRRATSGLFAAIDRSQMALTWGENESTMYTVVVEQAQWRLPEWKAIAELAPPDQPKPAPSAPPPPSPPAPAVASSSKSSVPGPHPATQYLAKDQNRSRQAPMPTVSSAPTQQPFAFPLPHPVHRESTAQLPILKSYKIPDPQRPTARNGAPFPMSEKARGKQPAVAPPPPAQTAPAKRPGIEPLAPAVKKRRRRTKAEMEAERAEAEDQREELAFYGAATRLSTAITMLSVLKDPTWKPDAALAALNALPHHPAPLPGRAAPARPPAVSLFRGGGAGPVVATPAPAPTSHAQPRGAVSHPFLDFNPTPAPPVWSKTIPAFAPIAAARRIPTPFSNIPLPVITSLPFPTLPPNSSFALTPRHLLAWPKALQPLTQEVVDSTWTTIQSTMANVTRHTEGGRAPSLQNVVQRAIVLIDPWCPKAGSPAEQIEVAKAKEAAGSNVGGKVARTNGVRPSPRIPVVPISEPGSRTVKTPLMGQTALPGGQSSSAASPESAPMVSRPSMSKSATGVHPLAQVWAKGTIEQRQVARERLLGAKGRSSPRSDALSLTSPRPGDAATLPNTPPGPSSSLATAAPVVAAPPAAPANASASVAETSPRPHDAPPLVPLPVSTTAQAALATVLAKAVPPAPTDSAARSAAPPQADASNLAVPLVREPAPVVPELVRKNSLLLDEGPPAAEEQQAAPKKNGRSRDPSREPAREKEAVAKRKGKGKGKEKEKEPELVLTKEMARARKKEREKLRAERGGVPVRFQLSNTPFRPFG